MSTENKQIKVEGEKKASKKKPTTTATTTKTTIIPAVPVKTCHKDPTEVIPRLFLGSADIMDSPHKFKFDVIVTLNKTEGNIWNGNWRGEIVYCPITDFSYLPIDVLEKYVSKVIKLLDAGAKVGVCCYGGHGRTGYFAAAVVGKLMPEVGDPIKFLRTNYCKKAVESDSQIYSLVEFLGMEELRENEGSKLYSTIKDFGSGYLTYWPNKYHKGGGLSVADGRHCFTCGSCDPIGYHCDVKNKKVKSTDEACGDYWYYKDERPQRPQTKTVKTKKKNKEDH